METHAMPTKMIPINRVMRIVGTADRQPADSSIRRAVTVRGLLGVDELGRAAVAEDVVEVMKRTYRLSGHLFPRRRDRAVPA
jgi:hypothetical protein